MAMPFGAAFAAATSRPWRRHQQQQQQQGFEKIDMQTSPITTRSVLWDYSILGQVLLLYPPHYTVVARLCGVQRCRRLLTRKLRLRGFIDLNTTVAYVKMLR